MSVLGLAGLAVAAGMGLSDGSDIPALETARAQVAFHIYTPSGGYDLESAAPLQAAGGSYTVLLKYSDGESVIWIAEAQTGVAAPLDVPEPSDEAEINGYPARFGESYQNFKRLAVLLTTRPDAVIEIYCTDNVGTATLMNLAASLR